MNKKREYGRNHIREWIRGYISCLNFRLDWNWVFEKHHHDFFFIYCMKKHVRWPSNIKNTVIQMVCAACSLWAGDWRILLAVCKIRVCHFDEFCSPRRKVNWSFFGAQSEIRAFPYIEKYIFLNSDAVEYQMHMKLQRSWSDAVLVINGSCWCDVLAPAFGHFSLWFSFLPKVVIHSDSSKKTDLSS